jgi:hypothetical protein
LFEKETIELILKFYDNLIQADQDFQRYIKYHYVYPSQSSTADYKAQDDFYEHLSTCASVISDLKDLLKKV